MGGDRAELVRESWSAIVDWCSAHAPLSAAALHGPAAETALTAAVESTGMRWPDQLLSWLRMSDGAGRSLDAAVIPSAFVPLGVDDIVAFWRSLSGMPSGGIADVSAAAAESAGSDSPVFLDQWLPIAANFCGGYLFLDLRPGPRHSCIGDFDDVDGFCGPPAWDDVAHMLHSVASALHAGPGDTDHDAVPTVDAGRLRWVDGPTSLELRANRQALISPPQRLSPAGQRDPTAKPPRDMSPPVIKLTVVEEPGERGTELDEST
ncbi:MAG TPA: SMI1/KNR4 family protein [Acidimicrobiia bacterium]|nr:SMI1/KNR4 family protein [Acidimicrobiia bacterium]